MSPREPEPRSAAAGACCALILLDREGRLLLARAGADPRWKAPAGTAGEGDIPRERALAAFARLTGRTPGRLRFAGTTTREALPALGEPALHLFFSDDRLTIPDATEAADLRWCAPGALAALPMERAQREIIAAFVDGDLYRGTAMLMNDRRVGVAVLALDRWGRVLLQLRDDDLPPERYPGAWSLPGGFVERGESPDRAALREFEEETGLLVDDLRLYRVYDDPSALPTAMVDAQHVYYADPDFDEAGIDVREGQAFRYFAPGEIGAIDAPPHARVILDDFFASPAYRALFH